MTTTPLTIDGGAVETLATATGTTPAQINHVLRWHRPMSYRTVYDLRNHLNMATSELAALLDMDPDTLWDVTTGTVQITHGQADTLAQICDDADATVNELATITTDDDPADHVLRIYTSNDAMKADGHPWAHYGAQWWRTVCERALDQAPGLTLTYAAPDDE